MSLSSKTYDSPVWSPVRKMNSENTPDMALNIVGVSVLKEHIAPHFALMPSCANACGLLLSRLDTMLHDNVSVDTGYSCGTLADRKREVGIRGLLHQAQKPLQSRAQCNLRIPGQRVRLAWLGENVQRDLEGHLVRFNAATQDMRGLVPRGITTSENSGPS